MSDFKLGDVYIAKENFMKRVPISLGFISGLLHNRTDDGHTFVSQIQFTSMYSGNWRRINHYMFPIYYDYVKSPSKITVEAYVIKELFEKTESVFEEREHIYVPTDFNGNHFLQLYKE